MTFRLLVLLVGSLAWLDACSDRPVSTGGRDAGPGDDCCAPDGRIPDARWADAGPVPADAYLTVTVVRTRSSWVPRDFLALNPAAYEQDYEWRPEEDPGFRGRFETVDGVPCDILYWSDMDGPTPQAPPPQVDVGRVWITGPEGESGLESRFGDSGYEPAAVSGSDLPRWARGPALQVVYHLGTEQGYRVGERQLGLSGPAALVEPQGESVPLRDDDTFRFEWTVPSDADEVNVVFTFNLDWDNSMILCHPDKSRTSMLVPAQWIRDYTWGSGQVAVRAVRSTEGPEGRLGKLLWYTTRLVWEVRRHVEFEGLR